MLSFFFNYQSQTQKKLSNIFKAFFKENKNTSVAYSRGTIEVTGRKYSKEQINPQANFPGFSRTSASAGTESVTITIS